MTRSSGRTPLDLSRPGMLVVRAGIVAWTGIGLAILVALLARMAGALRLMLFSLALAVLIVAVFEPLVSRLVRRGIPRWLSVLGVYLAVMLPLAIGFAALTGALIAQVRGLIENAPDIIDGLGTIAHDAWGSLDRLGVPLPADDPVTWVADNQDGIFEVLIRVAVASTRAPVVALAMLIGPAIAFYLLLGLPRLRASAVAFLPPRRRDDILEGVRIVGRTIGAFVRGQLLIALVVGIASTIGLILLGVPFALVIGAIAGVSNLVPFFGPIMGSIPGVILAWSEGGFWLAFWVVVLFTAIQQLESYVLSPLIIGSTVRLRPFFVAVGMLAGLAAAGLLGMVVAIPIMASVKSLLRRFSPWGAETAPAGAGQ